ncbi:hypothetical protein FHW69_002177 [Luteibacter sp. Sphag1AF]|uniref:hypothetical protein n=1 Tax=Luteibacter sp. Sphag1AF TaxID=2587031 RepID=UPI00161BD9FC|nr:hypothetical protein [Luteibacter sp. Sphag1AF]MBB3227554.1 hypothetical protein [Luteibacter sp. Sphag1AF]
MWKWLEDRFSSTPSVQSDCIQPTDPTPGPPRPATVIDEDGNPVIPLPAGVMPQPSGSVTELASAKARRHMRMAAFVLFALISVGYFAFLLYVLMYWLLQKESIWILTRLQHQPALLIGAALVIFASVPLSLTLAMVRLAQDPQPKGASDDAMPNISAITTPGLEAIKAIAETLKSAGNK